MTGQLELDRISVRFADTLAVDRVSLSLGEAEIGCLLGPSGCGKTTILRVIAGFETLDRGEVRLHGRCVSSQTLMVPPEKRRVGMVFQDFALFPHLSVVDNIGFGLRQLKRAERKRRVDELLRLIGLEQAAQRHPHQLSGGQQQRVALARAMAPRPDILLLDEPFSALDPELREQLATEVRGLLKEDGITAILVTHDQVEAFAMADRIGVMHQGRLHQWDSGYRLYHRPQSTFVADFIGRGVLLPVTVSDQNSVESPLGRLSGKLPRDMQPERSLKMLIRPDDILLNEGGEIHARVLSRVFQGAEYLYILELPSGHQVECLAPSHREVAAGSDVGLRLDIRDLVLFREDGSGLQI
jgi:iron(III) transport system ATP-binding protein